MTDKREGPLSAELQSFERLKPNLEQNHMGKFVVIKDDELLGAWDTFDNAAKAAIQKYGRGPYLIRQVGGGTTKLPASVMFRAIEPA
ncbi:hypothetical protein CWB41_14120 [Methylovirgula ligni]|uniref:DUF5678 domain-containing protein n=1 Tax=Methylovirgula ligni TaxID=569860 RepID=A0A3D9YWF5_9HYPH|nr:hypothetical protein [Methylovirgula ligni]QAY97404.1 hypothetical protein CWB41_14120 [Methylovirgula ligni]REF83229.1 hypothetical protein DES32_3145 [Methylovirgula ligni]